MGQVYYEGSADTAIAIRPHMSKLPLNLTSCDAVAATRLRGMKGVQIVAVATLQQV